MINQQKMNFILLSIVCLVNFLALGNSSTEERQLGDSLVIALKSHLDRISVDDFKMRTQLGSSAGFHFNYEIELKSIEITGLLATVELIQADVVRDENGNNKFIAKILFGDLEKIKSAVSINNYESTMVTVDIVDRLVAELSVSLKGKTPTKVNVTGGEQILLHPLPITSTLTLVQDKLMDAFVQMINKQLKPMLGKFVKDVAEIEFKKMNGGF